HAKNTFPRRHPDHESRRQDRSTRLFSSGDRPYHHAVPRFRGTGVTGYLDGPDHSGLMFAARITLPHFSVSSATSLPNSAGVIGMGSPASSARRACNFGSANTAFTAWFSVSTIPGGVPLGELGEVVGWECRIHVHHVGQSHYAGDRDAVADEIA